ncbi:hypothetical protein N7478_001395 [Penicillium angulare]|uniref:uncharacterized protein n=1 Tax=Penicillium angulare TaxID=116970 RepID=UPI002541D9BC|nr:uncharacterized protein N7478_001395 [Penicillium angulare]KAJ5292144.1 hypothetical protein N7478_001395 [Penicillium angulare]
MGSGSLPEGLIYNSAPDGNAAKEVTSFEMPMTNESDGRRNRLRFNIALVVPTAMVEYPGTCESYLNRGQTYTLRVIDTLSFVTSSRSRQYRTFVRVSFENEDQRSNSASSWQLWIDSRGSSEAHLESRALLAVEYIHTESAEAKTDYEIQLEKTSVDGFCVIRSARPTASLVHCAILMRFNFTSTDFSHSKGVKGIPLRLCAKTQALPSDDPGITRGPELCCCKIKVFRNHGAERRLANDNTRVKKVIEKLQREIALLQANSAIGLDRRKRRRMSLDGAAEPSSQKDCLLMELARKQDMLRSTLSISVLNLRCDKEDDPDLFPVQLPARNTPAPTQNNALEAAEASFLTPIVDVYKPTGDSNDQSLPKQELIACFVVRFADDTSDLYRVIYLTERTVQDLTRKICERRHIDPLHVVRILHINKDDLKIVVDDDVFRELPEGQSMIVEIDSGQSLFGNGVAVHPAVEIRLEY